MPRLHRQAKVSLHLLHQPVDVSVRIHNAQVLQFFQSISPRVAQRQFNQAHFIAPLGHRDLHPVDLQVQRLGKQDFRRFGAKELPQLGHTHGQQFGVGLVQFLFKLQGVPAHHRAFAQHQAVDVRKLGVAQQREDVGVPNGGVHHGGFGLVFFQ